MLPIELAGAKVLIVDDTPENLKLLRQTLESEGYSIMVAGSGEAALQITQRAIPDLVLLDVMMPGIDGFTTCRCLKEDERTADIPVIFITARAETEAIIEGFEAGGVDYVVKPFQDREVLMRVRAHLQINSLARELENSNAQLRQTNEQLRGEIARREAFDEREAEHWGVEGFIGESETVRAALSAIERLQSFDTPVLINGESGTGKELIARSLHHGSPRREAPFVPVNCSAIPGELAESILFGHVKGAFTGADRDRTGYFELANGGTLFLDEVGDMPLAIQAKMLRVLEDGRILPIGGTEEKQVDVRVLSATNIDLESRIAEGSFRQDLYFRLARFPVRVPPLRERRQDIDLLARHFLRMFATEMGTPVPALDPEAIQCLESYHYPGNVRELKNIIERALIEGGGTRILPQHLHFLRSPDAAPSPPDGHGRPHPAPVQELPLNLKEAEEALIQRALNQTNGNIAATARLLGTNRPRIYKYLENRQSVEE